MEYYDNRDYTAGYPATAVYHVTDEDDIQDGRNGQFDLLSLLSTVLHPDLYDQDGEWAILVFLSIHLGPWNMFQPYTPYSGTSFSVTLMSRDHIVRQTTVTLDDIHSVPRLLALKTPKLKKEPKSAHNSRLFRSMIKEYRILQSEALRSHDNIVKVLGCCWQTLETSGGEPIPSLILEGTKLGDLIHFSRTRDPTLRERLRLCIHITSGLQAIHAVGVVHGDLKPENVLVFRSLNRGYIAKIADFGSAILLSETALPAGKPNGTIFYSGPECDEEGLTFGRDELFKIDIFSLGVTLASLIFGMNVLDEMKKLSPPDLLSLKKSGEFPPWLAATSYRTSADTFAYDGAEDGSDDEEWVTDLNWCDNSVEAHQFLEAACLMLMEESVAASVQRRCGSAEKILWILKFMLRLHLRTLLRHQELSPEQGENPEWWARMSRLMGIGKARLRKLTGMRIGLPCKLNEEELEAISQCCEGPVCFLREARFILGRSTAKRRTGIKSRLRKPWRKSPYSAGPKVRTFSTPEAVVRLANRMLGHKNASIERELKEPSELKSSRSGKEIFKATQHSNLFWMLPPAVKEVLETQILQRATDDANSEAQRADAAYEYANIVFSSGHLSVPRLEKALKLLAMSAESGHFRARCSVGRLSSAFGYPSPVNRSVEIEWLQEASLAGSVTAQRRFREMDSKGFLEAMQGMRRQLGGVCPEANKILLEQCQGAKDSGRAVDAFLGSLYESAVTGNVQLILQIGECPKNFYKCRNLHGETPLLVACRGGQTAVAELLLARGADPSHATWDGVTPLHFLAAFEDKDIPRMASLLLQHGANLESVCKKSSAIYKELADSPFGVSGGTPLFWAVAARNSCATKVLMDKGANPFLAPNPSGLDGPGSPLAWAAMLHEYDLLEIMLSRAQDGPLGPILQPLLRNPNSEVAYAFHTAVDCNNATRFREYLIHGKLLEDAALRCVQILINFIAEPTMLTCVHDHHPMIGACISGNIKTVKYLWDYLKGVLRPTPKMWSVILGHVIFHGHHTVFDFLIQHRGDIATDMENDAKAVRRGLRQTNDWYIVLGLLKLILQPKAAYSPSHLRDIFLTAVLAGHFEAANVVFQEGHLSLTSRIGGETLLGGIIGLSFRYPDIDQKVSFIISLSSDKDELFRNVSYFEGCGLTALQAVVYASTSTSPMSTGVLEMIIKHYSEPKYLNVQIQDGPSGKFAGYSALHLAAECGNHAAVAVLLHLRKAGLDINLRNSRGETPADICVGRELESADEEGSGGFHPDEPYVNWRRQANMDNLSRLLSEGGLISKYTVVIKRRTWHDFDVLSRAGNMQLVQLLDLVTSDPTVSESSCSLVAHAPIGSLLAFVDRPSVVRQGIPGDLEACILANHRAW